MNTGHGKHEDARGTGLRRIAAWRWMPIVLLVGLVGGVWWWRGADGGATPGHGSHVADTDNAVRDRIADVRSGDTPLAVLVRGALDRDWRVRAAAFEALHRQYPLPSLPHRDTPMAERQRWLVDWLDAHADASGDRWCEWVAGAPHTQFAEPVVDRCLSCHAGPAPSKPFASSACISCHEGVVAEWPSSSHANSLSHLQLATVDPVTRQPGWFDFGDRRGLSCVACHTPAGSHERCVSRFETVSCLSCHGEVEPSWRQWNQGERLQRVTWPPGVIQSAPSGKQVSCVDCHMPDASHRLTARRDIGLLRSGISADLVQQPDGGVAVRLTNLAGHINPAGSSRRALDVRVSIDGQPERRLILLASPHPDGREEQGVEPPLSPNETRDLRLDARPQRVSCRVVYVRDRFAEAGSEVDVTKTSRTFVPSR